MKKYKFIPAKLECVNEEFQHYFIIEDMKIEKVKCSQRRMNLLWFLHLFHVNRPSV